jgi:6-pyruvoyltetrahydropterin/6-carboxytetrahydropterin synthase
MSKFLSTKIIELGSTAFRQPKAESHCKFIHGYQLKAKIWFATDKLDDNNWVFDFGGLKELKTKLQSQFDHKCIIAENDPAKHVFKELSRYNAIDMVVMDGVGIEKFAEYVYNEADTFVKFKTKNRVWVEQVEVFEHENNSALYRKETTTPARSKHITKKEEVVSETINLNDFVDGIAPQSSNNGPKPAPLRNPVSSGWSNPFGGTSWGA